MARGKSKKQPLPASDPVYGNRLVTRLINRMMHSGKKILAQRLVYRAFAQIKQQGQDPVKVLEAAISNIGPRMEVRPRRIGGASYQVPVEVRGDRRLSLAIRWLVQAAQKRANREYHTFDSKLAAELLAAAQNQGEAVRKRELTHRMAEANKAFAHFRW